MPGPSPPRATGPALLHGTSIAPGSQQAAATSGTSEALGLLRLPVGALVPAQPSLLGVPKYGMSPVQPASCSTPAVPLCCRCNSVCWHLSVLKACPDQQPDIRKEQIKKLVYFLRLVA